MLKLCEIEAVQRLERFRLIGRETSENEGEELRLIDQACEEIFGAHYTALPDWFFEELEPWENAIDQKAWARQRGFEITNEFAQLLSCADEMGHMIEAIERGILKRDDSLIAKHQDKAWESRLLADAARFSKSSRK
ncbi:MAG: hypothetical protein ACXIVL_07415 [Oceanicaulis sp.]